MKKARLLRKGNHQIVRLPPEFRLAGDIVSVKRVGRGVLLLPTLHHWDVLVQSLNRFSEDFMADRDQRFRHS